VFVIPFEQLNDCTNTLSASFTRITALRMSDPESVRFQQIVIFGARRNIRGAAIEEGRRRLRLMAGHDGYDRLPVLEPGAVESFAVPGCGEATMIYRGLPYDLIEDMLPGSAAWKQAAPTLLAREDTVAQRSIWSRRRPACRPLAIGQTCDRIPGSRRRHEDRAPAREMVE
jgi:hypothetical protein